MESAVQSEAQVRQKKRNEIYATDILIGAIIILVTFRGFIENTVGYGTFFVDLCFFLLFVWELYVCFSGEVRKSRHRRILQFYVLWMILCFVVGFFQVIAGKTSVYDAIIGYRNNNIYTGLFLIAALRLSLQGVKHFYKLFVNCGVFICFFAIIQYVFRDFLPQSFLVLNGEGIFMLYGSDVIRVTGLMGNTIIFGGFAVVLFSLVWAEILARKYQPIVLWAKLIIIALANYFTFSRASVAGMAAVFVLEFVIYGCTHGKTLEYLAITLIFLAIGIILVLTLFSDSIIVQRILGLNDAWTAGSDKEHFNMIEDAMNMIGENWFIGALYGRSNTVVTDGSFWAYLLEMGIPVFIVYVAFLLTMFVIALKNCRNKDRIACTVSVGYLGMNAYLLIASFINSAYSARSVLVFVWLIAGMVLATILGAKKEKIKQEGVCNDS